MNFIFLEMIEYTFSLIIAHVLIIWIIKYCFMAHLMKNILSGKNINNMDIIYNN